VQIGDENVHRVRAVMDEVFGDKNLVSLIAFVKTQALGAEFLPGAYDYIVWFAKDKKHTKFRPLLTQKSEGVDMATFAWVTEDNISARRMRPEDADGKTKLEHRFRAGDISRQGASEIGTYEFEFEGGKYWPSGGRRWASNPIGMTRLARSSRIQPLGNVLSYRLKFADFPVMPLDNGWHDTYIGTFTKKTYVVQTGELAVQRCILMATDPGDLVLDPTCGSGTTAYVAEQWGRRWITIDTSRVALALARARIMGARYPYYLLADSPEGKRKEMEIVGRVSDSVTRQPAPQTSGYAALTRPTGTAAQGNIRHGFVYERVPYITLKSIANNAEIDIIWDKWQATLEPLRERLNQGLVGWAERSEAHQMPATDDGLRSRSAHPSKTFKPFEEWEIPREADAKWPEAVKKLYADWWQTRIARQKEIDASIAAKAEFEYLYDKPYQDNKKVRVAGPFTVESLSPHRVLGVDENDELIDPNDQRVAEPGADYGAKQSFPQMILENLKTAGVQQAQKDDKITFTALKPWPGDLICAEGRYIETRPSPQPSPQRGEGANAEPSPSGLSERGEGEGSGKEKRAAILIGPEFGTVTRPDLVAAAREAGDADFDVLIACAFNYEAHATEFTKLGRILVLKARMNADLQMAEDLKNTGKGNLFVIFGEPDIKILDAEDGKIRVKVNGVDVFHPQTGEVRSDGPEGIACWFIDTDYNEESFFVRHAYFLGANDPYSALKTTLKAEINEEAWATLNSETSRAFPKPKSGRIAVKVINHLGDEVMKVFKVT